MSTIAVDNARPSAGGTSYSLTSGVAKAWLSYDQAVNSLFGSYNLASVTDASAGKYTYSFTNNMASATDWAAFSTGGADDADQRIAWNSGQFKTKTTTGWGVRTTNTGGINLDSGDGSTSAYGDLA